MTFDTDSLLRERPAPAAPAPACDREPLTSAARAARWPAVWLLTGIAVGVSATLGTISLTSTPVVPAPVAPYCQPLPTVPPASASPSLATIALIPGQPDVTLTAAAVATAPAADTPTATEQP